MTEILNLFLYSFGPNNWQTDWSLSFARKKSIQLTTTSTSATPCGKKYSQTYKDCLRRLCFLILYVRSTVVRTGLCVHSEAPERLEIRSNGCAAFLEPERWGSPNLPQGGYRTTLPGMLQMYSNWDGFLVPYQDIRKLVLILLRSKILTSDWSRERKHKSFPPGDPRLPRGIWILVPLWHRFLMK